LKPLVDENLSPRLVELLADIYPGSAHVHECGLGSSDDSEIWVYAKTNGFTIVSKDSDFEERSILFGYPPKVILLRARNCSSKEIATLLRKAFPQIDGFIGERKETCLILGSQRREK
jgi:predicted nuclease of predicted toxin-antitoxin system